jgi:hypothetical protein
MPPPTLARLAAVLCLQSLAFSAPESENENPAARADNELTALSRLPGLFPIMPWDTLHTLAPPQPNPDKGLEEIAACHFTLAGFVEPQDLPQCRKLGLLAMIAPPRGKEFSKKHWLEAGDDEIEQYVRGLIGDTANDPAVLGYYIIDEPGGRTFPALGKAVAAVKKYAPGKLAYINLFPNYSTLGSVRSRFGTDSYQEYLERFVQQVQPQIISYDNYLILHTDDMQDAAKVVPYFTNLVQVRQVALKHGLPYWNIVCGNQIRPPSTVPSPANLSLQAYTTLAAGFRGLSWYKFFYYDGMYRYSSFDSAGHRTSTWLYLQMINRQVSTLGPLMNRLESTGVFFSEPAPDPSLPRLPGRIVKQVTTTTSPRGFVKLSPPVMVGEFKDPAGVDHVMIVNLSLERSIHFELETAKHYTKVQVYSAVDSSLLPFTDREGHWLTAGQGELIRLE